MYMYISIYISTYIWKESPYKELAHPLWRLRIPVSCCLQAGHPAKLVVKFNSSLKT